MPFLRALTICAALAMAHSPAARAAADPFEAANRQVFAFNQAVRRWVLAPAAERYRAVTSPEVRAGIVNVLANLREPVTAVSSLAVGDIAASGNAVVRFAVNSTVGLGGVRDQAAGLGYPRQAATFADAACRLGVPSGPFLMLPLLGPSTARDAAALAAQGAVLDQTLGMDATLALAGSDLFAGYAELHPDLKRLDADSLDPYAAYRSIYLQRRAVACPTDSVETP